MAVGGGVGNGKSGPPMARGCFLLVLVVLLLLLLLLDEAHALAASQPASALGTNNNNRSVKFRGSRSALMHPTAIVFSPPNKTPERQQPALDHFGSSTSNFKPPGGVSNVPSTRGQLDQYSQGMPSLATPAVTPGPFIPGPHSWAAGGGGYPPNPTFTGFGLERRTHLTPASARWGRQRNPTFREGNAWPAPADESRWWPPKQTQHTPDITGSDRSDTFGHVIKEDLSHLHNRPTGWRSVITEGDAPVGGLGRGGRRGEARSTILRPTEVVDEGVKNRFDFNGTSENQPDDYNAYNENDHSKTHDWLPAEHTPSPPQATRILTFQHVMEIQNLASQADLHALLDQRGVTFDELRDFLKSGARKKDVIEFLKAPTPSATTITTTANPPVLLDPLSEHDVSVIEEGYQDDVTRQASLPENEEDDTDVESKEQTRKNRKKGRRGKGGRRKNKRRKGKKNQEGGASNTTSSPNPQVNHTTETPEPNLWVPSTPRLPEITTSISDTTKGILLTTTHPPTPDTTATSPPSGKTSDASIVSVTLMKAPTDPKPETSNETTILENPTPPRKPNTHPTTNFGITRHPWQIPRPARPSPQPEDTKNEIEKVNFVHEKRRDDYVFPLRGLLIISGLMGALAVFTLVVLISYAIIKCSKKPVVNNYQVSKQQKSAGT